MLLLVAIVAWSLLVVTTCYYYLSPLPFAITSYHEMLLVTIDCCHCLSPLLVVISCCHCTCLRPSCHYHLQVSWPFALVTCLCQLPTSLAIARCHLPLPLTITHCHCVTTSHGLQACFGKHDFLGLLVHAWQPSETVASALSSMTHENLRAIADEAKKKVATDQAFAQAIEEVTGIPPPS